MLRRLAVLASIVVCAAACSTGATGTPRGEPASGPPIEVWGLPDDPMGLARAAGLEPETQERLAFHVHAHLDVFKDGREILVPGGIGIDTTNPGVKRFDDNPLGPSFGGIERDCPTVCISPLHTHDPDGVLHTESATSTPNTFGQFLTEWGVTLPDGTKAWVNGHEWTDPIADIELSDGREIAVIIGTPPAEIPGVWPPDIPR